jgi:hypothetical protein
MYGADQPRTFVSEYHPYVKRARISATAPITQISEYRGCAKARGRGIPLETRFSIYSELITAANDHGVPAALCKEPVEVWEKFGLKGPCNCMPRKE